MKILPLTIAFAALVSQSLAAADWERFGTQYEAKTAAAKHADLWKQITANTKANSWFSTTETATLFIESMDPSVHWVGDTFQNGWNGPRNKYIHTVGSTATVKFVASKNTAGYTGVFQGADYGIIRLSTGGPYDTTKPAAGNFVPAFGLKFLRDKVPSANVFGMYSIDGMPSWNFFDFDFSNHIPGPTSSFTQAVATKFQTVTTDATMVGLSDWAQYTQAGQKVSTPNFPYQIFFEPNPAVKSMFTSSYSEDYRTQVQKINVGTTLYKVTAKNAATASRVYIGDLVLTSKFTDSFFADKYLFFKHQSIDEDWKLKPEYKGKYVKSSQGCPFAKTNSFFGNIRSYFMSLTGLF
jgi:hypothetical protein